MHNCEEVFGKSLMLNVSIDDQTALVGYCLQWNYFDLIIQVPIFDIFIFFYQNDSATNTYFFNRKQASIYLSGVLNQIEDHTCTFCL